MAMEPGWYPDPFSSGGYVRWWDGERWGASTSVGTTAPTSSAPDQPVPMPAPLPPPPAPYAAQPQRPVAAFPLATWPQRAAARILDSLVEALIALPFVLWLVWPAVQKFVDVLPTDGSAPSQEAMTSLQRDLLEVSSTITVISLLVSLLYQAPQNKRWGRTLGKRVLGIRIRPLAADVGLTWGQVLARWGLFEVFSLVLGGVLLILDCLWPLWDRPWRQALHDKVARTVVVPRR